jgi:D-alanyl-D-alanine carboxypeptidase/D-alanyl-D-alanine-endopeptidase (penicillin-binding protein 4)
VRGDLLADDFRYDAERLGNGWNWDDEPYYYSAQVSALSVNRNVLTVDVLPTEAGKPVEVRVKPVEGVIKIVERPVTGAPGAQTRISVVRERGRNEVRVTGTMAEDAQPIRDRLVTMEEPQLYAAALFRKLLADRGIRVSGEVRRAAAPSDADVLAEHRSAPMSEIVSLLNKPSDNLIAEMLVKELGKVCKDSGDWNTGTEVVEEWLKSIGIDTGGVKVNDGSGLSRMDLVTARAVSDLLVRAQEQPWRDSFLSSLPVAGVDGTLRNRMRGTAAEKNVRAKTGTLLHVTALSGYVTGALGERLVFSILINHFPGPASGPAGSRQAEDAIALAVADYRAD